MRQTFNIIICLFMLLPVSLNAEVTQNKTDENYFKDYPESTTKIAPNGETVIVADSSNRRVQVIFKAFKGQHAKLRDKQNNEKSRCIPQYRVSIAVNDKKILIPSEVFGNLHSLNRGKIIIDGDKLILILDGGDASTGYDVIIEFDQERVTRKREYFTCCDPEALLEDKIY
jgi:hypothetical protein